MADDRFPLAFVQIEGKDDVDSLFDELSRQLEASQCRVGGFLQSTRPDPKAGCATMFLENIATREHTMLSQPLGAGSQGCRLDYSVLAEATSDLSARINSDFDLLILNRFGKAEAEGQGFRSVFATALESDLPVLTAVKVGHREAWDEFAGEFAEELPFDLNRLLEWSRSVLSQAGKS